MLTEREQDFLDTLSLEKVTFVDENFFAWLCENNYFTAPASTKYHGAYEGGLYDHQKQVYLRLKELTNNNKLSWQRKESPFVVGMFHDLCKCDQYKTVYPKEIKLNDGINVIDINECHYEYNDKTLIKGHGTKSVLLLSQFTRLTEEEMLAIRYHMGPYETDDWDGLDRAIRKYQNVYWAHVADMLASKVDDV